MRIGLRPAVRGTLHAVGLDLVRHDAAHSSWRRRAVLLAGRGVGLVLDGGANSGQYASGLRRAGYGGRIVSFEPLPDAFARLERACARDPRWDCLPLALGDEPGAATINVAANSFSSSLLPITSRHVESAPQSATAGSAQVEVVRLDDVAGGLLRPGERVWLKLDVQGYELPALRGAAATLERVDVVECELSLVPLYEGQELLAAMLAELDALGFAVHDLEPEFRDPGTGQLLQLNGIFARR